MPYSAPHAWPRPTGHHPVGYRQFELTDARRPAYYSPEPQFGRLTQVSAWYPAASVAGIDAMPYLTRAEARLLPALLMKVCPAPEDALDHCANVRTASHPGAALDTALGKLPVIVFNHGGLSYARQNQALMEELASHGYLVLALGRPYESGGVILDDGREISLNPALFDGLMTMGDSPESTAFSEAKTLAERKAATVGYLKMMRRDNWLASLAQAWREDTLFVIDCLEDGRVPEAVRELAAAADTAALGYCGMSFGAGLTGMLAQGDPRCKAAWNIDGGFWSGELYDTQIRTPYLVFHSDLVAGYAAMGVEAEPLNARSQLISDLHYETISEAGKRQDVPRMALPGVMHLAFSDLPLVVPSEFSAGFGASPAVGPRYVEIQNRLGLDFFNQYIRGVDCDFPQRQLKAFPELIQQDVAAALKG